MRGMFSVWVCYSQPFWRTEAAAQKSHCARSRSCNVGPRAAERGLGRCCGPRGSLWGPQGKAGEVDGRAPRRGRLNARNRRLEGVNVRYLSVQLNIINPLGGVKVSTKTAN